jgi:hypothetical protein
MGFMQMWLLFFTDTKLQSKEPVAKPHPTPSISFLKKAAA